MNFGKRAVNKKRNDLTSHSTMMGKKANVSFLRIIFISLMALLVIVGCTGIGALRGLIDSARFRGQHCPCRRGDLCL